jgi:hypothetical protein
MATVSITIPDGLVPRIISMMRANFPEHDQLNDVDTFKRITSDYWRYMLADYEKNTTIESGRRGVEIAAQEAYLKAVSDTSGIQ